MSKKLKSFFKKKAAPSGPLEAPIPDVLFNRSHHSQTNDLPEYQIPRGKTILPDGEIVESLLIDYLDDENYALAKMIKKSKEIYIKKIKKFECGVGKREKNIDKPRLECHGLN
jgi:xanthine dehydrogenase iron-sulfur cluster and FAD-binding subunit A